MTGLCEKQQKAQLRSILQQNEAARLFQHLGLSSIDPQSSFPELYKAFKQHAPLQTYDACLKLLRQLGQFKNESDVEVLAKPGLASQVTPVAFGRGRQGFFPPLTASTISFVSRFETGVHFCADKLGLPLDGKILFLFDNAHFDQVSGYDVGDVRATQLRYTPAKAKKYFLPDLAEVTVAGKSRHQTLHVFADILERDGPSIQTIVGEPRRLTELSLLLAQRYGKFVPLSQLCPNLKFFVQDGGDYDPYTRELEHIFQGLEVKRLVAYSSAMGAFGFTADPQQPTDLILQTDGGVFYEFVPVAHVRSDGTVGLNAERFWLQNAQPEVDYALFLTTPTGLVSVGTGDVVRLLSLEPLKIRFIRRANYLNHFGERLTTTLINPLVNTFNHALAAHNLFIRDYMVADHLAERKQYWAIELSRPVHNLPLNVLQSMANRLHRELLQNHVPYRQAFQDKRFNAPEVFILPMGTFSTMPDSFRFSYLDRSEDARQLLSVINHTAGAAIKVRASLG